MKNLELLNIGCGAVFHPEWTNIDIISHFPEVRSYDIRKNLPYPDSYFDACYSSHVLEHLKQDEARSLLKECLRVLKPQGILRVVVPDLEGIVRGYLGALEKVEAGEVEFQDNYDWMMLELYDQAVRNDQGGEMVRYLRKPELKNKEFVINRLGREVEVFWEKQKNKESKSLIQKIQSTDKTFIFNKIRYKLAILIINFVVGKKGMQAFKEGNFRNQGEIHQWMYDRFSLRRLLEEAGFVEIKICQAAESRIPNYNRYGLDIHQGKVRKPDSLFMEGIKG